MKILKFNFPILVLLAVFLMSCGSLNLAEIQKEAEKALGTSSGNKPLTNERVISGLKQALEIGSKNAASTVSQTNGYLKNPNLFIPFPPEAQKAEEKLRSLGFDKLVDDFVVSVNRAAEDAASEAAPIFVNAIKGMSISDGFEILRGPDDAATNFLMNNTTNQLTQAFQPKIKASLDKVNATKYWADVIGTYNKIPGVKDINPSLDSYVTQQAIKGLFVMVEKEESKIRQDPAARVTDLLKDVFGSIK